LPMPLGLTTPMQVMTTRFIVVSKHLSAPLELSKGGDKVLGPLEYRTG